MIQCNICRKDTINPETLDYKAKIKEHNFSDICPDCRESLRQKGIQKELREIEEICRTVDSILK